MALAEEKYQPTQESDAPVIKFRGHEFTPLLSGALFWQAENTLLVADLHFEKMSSFASRGQLLPPYDTSATIARLAKDLRTTGASRVICLGDSFHRDEGTRTLLPKDRAQLTEMITELEWVWLAGNHDPSPHALGGKCQPELTCSGITFSHEPTSHMSGQIAGHLHPAARVRINARSVRRPCFAYDNRLMILPAFGVSTGSLNILSQPFDGLFRDDTLQVTMIGRDQLYPVSAKRLVGR